MDKSGSLHDYGMDFVEGMEGINRYIAYLANKNEADLERLGMKAPDQAKLRDEATSQVLRMVQADPVSRNDGSMAGRINIAIGKIQNALKAAHAAKADGVPLGEEPVWGLITAKYFNTLPPIDSDPVRLAICFMNLSRRDATMALIEHQRDRSASLKKQEPLDTFVRELGKIEPWKLKAGITCG